MALVMGATRRGKAVLVFYSYALVTRKCQPALAHSLVSATFHAGDMTFRSFSTDNATAKARQASSVKAGGANGPTVRTNSVRDLLNKHPVGNDDSVERHNDSMDTSVADSEPGDKRKVASESDKDKPVHSDGEDVSGKKSGRGGRISTGDKGAPEVIVHARKKSIREYVREFVNGAKLLWSEISLAKKTKAKQKAGKTLSFQEQRLLRQVPRDVAKALPLLFIFAVPVAGYLAPLIGVFYPKALLPAQFWSSPQRRDYMLEDALEQEVSSFPEVLASLVATTSPPRPNCTPAQLRAAARWFDHEGTFDRLSRVHLMRLVRACNVMPVAKKASANLVPKSFLISWLNKEAASIRDDDLALLRRLRIHGSLQLATTTNPDETSVFEGDGPGEITHPNHEGEPAKLLLSPEELSILCWERGLLRTERGTPLDRIGGHSEDADAFWAEVLLERLEGWLSLYSDDSRPRDTARSFDGNPPGFRSEDPHSLPPSLLLHAPALLRRMPASLDSLVYLRRK